MLKIAAVAVIAAICAAVVKKQAQEIGMVLVLAAGVLILTYALGAIGEVRTLLETLADAAGLESAILAPVVKTVGVAIVTKITAEICRDAKEGGLASFVETAGAATALFIALPLVKAVLNMVTGLL